MGVAQRTMKKTEMTMKVKAAWFSKSPSGDFHVYEYLPYILTATSLPFSSPSFDRVEENVNLGI